MERMIMKLDLLSVETLTKVNEAFRKKVQLKEQLDESEIMIHFYRGMLFAFNKVQEVAKELQEGEQIEAMHEGNHPEELEEIPKKVTIL